LWEATRAIGRENGGRRGTLEGTEVVCSQRWTERLFTVLVRKGRVRLCRR
jgi:hypothetical protein